MTLWHQRLIFFLSKILAGLIIIVIIAIVLYYNFYFKKDNLIKYVPARAVAYLNFRLDREFLNLPLGQKLQAELPMPIKEEDLGILNPLVGNNSSLALVPNQSASGFDYLLVFSLQETDGKLEPYLTALDRVNWQHLIMTNQLLDRKVLVLSNSSNLLEEVQEISRQEKPSLADRVEVILGLGKFKIGYSGKLYVNFAQAIKILANDNDPRLVLLQAILTEHKVSDLFWGLKIKGSSLVLDTKYTVNNPAPGEFLINKVPADFEFSFSFFDLKDNLNQTLKTLAQKNSVLYTQIQNNRQYLEDLAGFSFEQDVLPFLADQAQIIMTQDQKFILAVKTKDVPVLADKITKLEEIAKQYLAIKNPILISKKLPDNTYISEIAKQPDNYIFSNQDINGTIVRQIQANDEEYSYFIKDDVLFLSNSSQKIADLLQDKDLITLESNEKLDNLANFSENLISRSSLLSRILPILANFEQITILNNQGNDNIRLIIE